MSRNELKNIILNSLSAYKPLMVGLFGSYVRNENKAGSDLDILVKFETSLSLLQLLHLENELSDKLGIKVDLVTEGSIKDNRIRISIQKDIQILFQA